MAWVSKHSTSSGTPVVLATPPGWGSLPRQQNSGIRELRNPGDTPWRWLPAMSAAGFTDIAVCRMKWLGGDAAQDVYNPTLYRTIPYHIAMSFVGCFLLVQLRKPFILDYQLPYPSATAGAVLINSLHSSSGEDNVCLPNSHISLWSFLSRLIFVPFSFSSPSFVLFSFFVCGEDPSYASHTYTMLSMPLFSPLCPKFSSLFFRFLLPATKPNANAQVHSIFRPKRALNFSQISPPVLHLHQSAFHKCLNPP